MSVLADSNVLVAATHDRHPDHVKCRDWLNRTVSRTEVIVSTHGLAEIYTTLTRDPGMFVVPLGQAETVVRQFRRHLRTVSLSGVEYEEAVRRAVKRDVRGPQIYDVLHTMAARKGGAHRIATMNTRHFVNIWPPSRLIDPRG